MAKKINFKYTKKIISNSLTYKLSISLDILLTVFSLLLITLYIIGNYQDFQDKTQQIILSALSYISIFNILLSSLLFVETIFKIPTEKQKLKNILNIFYLILAIVLSIIFSSTSNIINYLSTGI